MGGKKTTVGYKYFKTAAISICRGEAYISRIFKNNQHEYFEDKSTMEIYTGTATQTTDPTLSAILDNPIPYRNTSYMVLDEYYIGKSVQLLPIFNFEVHRYPYNSNAGDMPRIYNLVNSKQSSSGFRNFSIKDNAGNIIVVNSDAINIYDKTFSLDRTIDVTVLDFSSANRSILDIDFIETRKYKNLYVLYNKTDTPRNLYCTVIDIRGNFINDIAGTRNYTTYEIKDGAEEHFANAAICHNQDNTFIAYNHDGTNYKIKKYTWNNVGSELAKYDITASMGVLDDELSIDVSDKYAFCSSSSLLVSFNISTFAKIDEINTTAQDTEAKSLLFLRGGDEILMSRVDATEIYFEIYGVDSSGNLTFRKEWEVTNEWDGTAPTGLTGPNMTWNNDGTILMSYGPNGEKIQHFIMDCNPAQIIYEIFTNELRLSVSDIDTTSLQDLSDYCLTNKIGISFFINAWDEANTILANIMTAVHGVIFQNNSGKFEIKIFRNSDSTEATITESELFGGFEEIDYGKVNILLKDNKLNANRINIKYIDRLEKYRESSFQHDNFLEQENDGDVVTENVEYTYFSNVKTVSRQALKVLKQIKYNTKIFNFNLMPEFLYLDIGMVLNLNISTQNLNNQRVRIISIDEYSTDNPGILSIAAMTEENFLNTFQDLNVEISQSVDTEILPPVSVRPFIWEQSSLLNNDTRSLCLGAIRYNSDTIGCDIYRSEDDSTFIHIGTLNKLCMASNIATAVGEDDIKLTINTDEFPDTFSTVTLEEQRNKKSFCIVGEFLTTTDLGLDDFEFLSFREVTANGNDLDLDHCYRGKYYTLNKSHSTSKVLLQVGIDKFFRILSYSEQLVGTTIYVKCVAFNSDGQEQELADVTSYSYTIQGYTQKATHVAGLQIEDGNGEMRGLVTTGNPPAANHVKLIWEKTARNGGISRTALGEWPWNRYIEGDRNNIDILVYDENKTLVKTYTDVGDVQTYEYTDTQNIADFSGLKTDFYLGVRPKNDRGFVPDIKLQRVKLV